MKTKVFLIGPVPPPVGGISNHIARLSQRILASDDIECFVFDAGRFRFFNGSLEKSNVLKAMVYFLTCDIIHIHLSNPWKVHIARLARAFGKKVIYTRHNIRNANSKGDRKLHALSDLAIHVSKTGIDLVDEKTFIIPAYISTGIAVQLNSNLLAQIKNYKTVIAAISTHPLKRPALMEGKDIYGFDILLNSYENLNTDIKVLVLLDPGGAMEPTYRSNVAALNRIGKDVIYLTENIDFCSLTEFMSIYVRPTRTDGDSIAIREAREAGVKVVASDCVERPKGVRLFKSEDIDSLTIALKDAIEGPKDTPEKYNDFSNQVIDLYRKVKNRA
jgi:glycosyltransferase involved in cell wall biosynthesis